MYLPKEGEFTHRSGKENIVNFDFDGDLLQFDYSRIINILKGRVTGAVNWARMIRIGAMKFHRLSESGLTALFPDVKKRPCFGFVVNPAQFIKEKTGKNTLAFCVYKKNGAWYIPKKKYLLGDTSMAIMLRNGYLSP